MTGNGYLKYSLRAVFLGLLVISISQAAVADVTITRLANEGVIIEDGQTRLMIDGLVVEPYALYGGLPPDLAQQFSTASGVFEDISLAFASHKHHDHIQPEYACKFLKASHSTRLITSLQVIELVRERCRHMVVTGSRVGMIEPAYSEPVILPIETAKITIFPLSHGTGKYAKLQNWGHVVEMGGVRVLHIGDAAMDATDFATAAAEIADLDVALIPFWFFQPGPGMKVVEQYMDAPHKLAVHIPPGEMVEVTEYLAEDYPEVLVLQKPGDQIVINSPAPVPE